MIENLVKLKTEYDAALRTVLEALVDTNVELEVRWDLLVDLREQKLLVGTPPMNDGFCGMVGASPADDCYLNRSETTSLVRVYERLLESENFQAVRLDKWREAVLQCAYEHMTEEFTYDW